jgi:hypothetical protein
MSALSDEKEVPSFDAVSSDAPLEPPNASMQLDLSLSLVRGLRSPQTVHQTYLYVDQGNGFDAAHVVSTSVDYALPTFVAKLKLDGSPVTGLRWDPVELRLCRMRLEKVTWHDENGRTFPVDAAAITSNGVRLPDGAFAFDTLDPMFFLPVAGPVAGLTIRGQGEVDDPAVSLAKIHDRQLRGSPDERRKQALADSIDVFRRDLGRYHRLETSLYFDGGFGFREQEVRRQDFPEEGGPFDLTFTLAGLAITSLRWDPVELRLCRMRLETVSWRDASGTWFAVDLAAITSNGVLLPNGTFAFGTLDPMLFLPVAGRVAEVRLTGHSEVDDPVASLAKIHGIQIQGSEHERRAHALAESVASLKRELSHYRRLETSLYLDTGSGFREQDVRRQAFPEQDGAFVLTFPLDGCPVKGLRWDPTESRLCCVRLEAVSWLDVSGVRFAVDLAAITSNGVHQADGAFVFDTLDPMLFLPVAGRVAQVTIRGHCQVDDPIVSLAKVSAALGERERRVQILTESVGALTRQLDPYRRLETSLYVDTGVGFREQEVRRQSFPARSGPFNLTFGLKAAAVASLRWDPVELRACKVHLETVSWRDFNGYAFTLDLAAVTSNGIRRSEGAFTFDTLDPMLFLPITGSVSEVTICGQCEIDDALPSLFSVNEWLLNHERLLSERERAVGELETQLGARTEQLRKTVLQLEEREQQLHSLESQLQTAEHRANKLHQSRRWRTINALRAACLFLPRLLSSF